MAQPPNPERQKGGRDWTFLGGEFREPQNADVLAINEANQLTGQRAIALALYALDLCGTVSITQDESTHQEIEAKLVQARDLTYEYGLIELREIREITKRYTPKNVPVLREVRRMAGEISARQTDPTPMIKPEMAHILETMLRIAIAEELGHEIPMPPGRQTVQ